MREVGMTVRMKAELLRWKVFMLLSVGRVQIMQEREDGSEEIQGRKKCMAGIEESVAVRFEAGTEKEVEAKAEARAEKEVETEEEAATRAEKGWESAAKATVGDRGWQGELPPRNCIGKYTVLRLLGKGGEGAVYLARDEVLHRLAAIKQICVPAERQQGMDGRVMYEAKLLRELRHPMLPVVYELLWDGAWYLVMEYIQGVTLRGYIEGRGCVQEAQARAWAAELLEVAAYLHGRKPPVIYCDLKPDNIIVCPDGHMRLVDFGAAVHRNYGGRDPGEMAATPGYAAPEQLGKETAPKKRVRSEESVQTGAGRRIYADERSDIYALGKILYYMVTGADPASPPYTTLSIRDYQPLLSDALERIIRRCIEDDPGQRYQTADEVRAAVMACSGRRNRPRRRSFIRAVEKRVWLTEMQDGILE